MTNKTNSVLYVGVTSNLIKRVYDHKQGQEDAFTSRYNLDRIVYFEVFEDINEAIKREKQIKGGSRAKKFELIRSFNPEFKDLWNEIASS